MRLFPLVLLGIGVVLLLVNFGVISLEIKEIFVVFFPYFIFLVGAKWLYSGVKRSSLFLLLCGGFAAIFSALLILDQFGIYEFAFSDGYKLWPILLILLAIWMLGSKKSPKVKVERKSASKEQIPDSDRQSKSEKSDPMTDEFDAISDEFDPIGDEFDDTDEEFDKMNDEFKKMDHHFYKIGEEMKDLSDRINRNVQENLKNIKIDISKSNDGPEKKINIQVGREEIDHMKEQAVKTFGVSHMSLKEPNWELTPLNLKSTVGDYYFDFSKAYIPDTEIDISIKTWVGDIKMIVPDDIPIKVDTKMTFGDVKIMGNYWGANCSYTSANYNEASRKLNIKIKSWAGDVRIERV
ncbi:cell wall-active antibiotics response protein LiaF [Bacillus litorisediminis]|uniref:cell wall-active antibiotics response protein LiaF n=1 Tax=Bacillus litorisediminis TaxID=2922713 RepID=UPI001FACEC8E|nr:cell wall-active antibiotics response protein LiaF [Bacillus litorisediminis]